MVLKIIEKWLDIDKFFKFIISFIFSLPNSIKIIIAIFLVYFLVLGLVTFLKKVLTEIPIKIITVFFVGFAAYLFFLKFF